MTPLVWFRHDLRVIDQPALDAALASAGDVHAIALLSPAIWKQHGWGANRINWYVESVHALERDLAAMDIPLSITHLNDDEDPADCIARHAASINATEVLFGIEAGLNEQRRDASVTDLLSQQGCTAVPIVTETILPLTDIRTKTGTYYKVYTPFRNAWDIQLEQAGLAEANPTRHTAPSQTSTNDNRPWTAGTSAALLQLDTFLKHRVTAYKTDRDRPDVDGTSTLSPWLAVGAISPTTCLRPLIDLYGVNPQSWPEGPRTWRNELIWREFYRYVMATNEDVSMRLPLQKWTHNVPWRQAGAQFDAWCTGETGIDIVDAAMKQLNELGWMHNRLRMITAMFLTKNLMIDWRLGEAYFASKLIDYDFASNNGGWQWSASTGTDAAPYFRIMNPDTQAERFDPDRSFRNRWLGETTRPAPITELKASRMQAISEFRKAKDLSWDEFTRPGNQESPHCEEIS
jgi:deoxyribodipyrimidine photo-lyase